MVFSAALRRATSFAVASLRGCGEPLLRRAPSLSGPVSSYIRPVSVANYRFYSSSAAVEKSAPPAPSVADLLKVVDVEIKCAEECDDHDRVEEIPDGFPFQIEDKKGTKAITLRRNFHGEEIEVLVSMPSIVTGEQPERQADEDDDNDEEDESARNASIPLTVTLTKGPPNDMSLEFTCTAYPDEVVIDSLSVKPLNESDDEMIAYEGPDFDDLDENLQKAFHKYLELRGISPITTNFLHEYMINKDSREYLDWLKKLKQFIEK